MLVIETELQRISTGFSCSESPFGRLGNYDCVVYDVFILGLTEAQTQEGGRGKRQDYISGEDTGFYETWCSCKGAS